MNHHVGLVFTEYMRHMILLGNVGPYVCITVLFRHVALTGHIVAFVHIDDFVFTVLQDVLYKIRTYEPESARH